MKHIAITREVSSGMMHCELTHLSREVIDIKVARKQHRRYEDCLAELGYEIHRLAAESELPDSVFIEDTAVVLDELAIITRPSVSARKLETPAVAEILKTYRKLAYIEPPATIDGGDVLRINQTLYIGLSSRTNPEAIEQMRRLLTPYGYAVSGVEVSGCLHLKSAITQVGENTLLINRAFVDADVFRNYALIDTDPSEPLGANALLVGDRVIYPAAFPKTQKRLEERGIMVEAVDMSEFSKAEGGVTCCSLLFSG
jgi:dimethylargininase